jgi:hypothetical protein
MVVAGDEAGLAEEVVARVSKQRTTTPLEIE